MKENTFWMTMGMILCYNGLGSGGVYLDLACRAGDHTLRPCRYRMESVVVSTMGSCDVQIDSLISIVVLSRDCGNTTL